MEKEVVMLHNHNCTANAASYMKRLASVQTT